MLSASAGSDLLFDEELCEQGQKFATKIWNAFRLIKGWNIEENESQPLHSQQAITWFNHRLNEVINELNDDFDKFRLSDAMMRLYKLIWDDFCSSYLEIIKPVYGKGIDLKTLAETLVFLEKLLALLHPYMPFLTEEIWQYIAERTPEQALIISSMPEAQPSDKNVLQQFEEALEVVSGVRTLRKDKNIPNKEALQLVKNPKANQTFDAVIEKLANATVEYSEQKPESSFGFRAGIFEYYVPVSAGIDVSAEKAKLTEELNYLKGFLASVEKKLSNEKFVNGAPEQVIANERKKQADAQEKIRLIEDSLKGLG